MIKMKRLTGKEYYPHGYCYLCQEDEYCDRTCASKETYEKLEEYEDLDEQNRLVKLPLKIGDIVYIPDNSRFSNNPVDVYRIYFITIKLTENGVLYSFEIELMNDNPSAFSESVFTYDDIGKDIFLTKEEALEKREKNLEALDKVLEERKRYEEWN